MSDRLPTGEAPPWRAGLLDPALFRARVAEALDAQPDHVRERIAAESRPGDLTVDEDPPAPGWVLVRWRGLPLVALHWTELCHDPSAVAVES